MDKLRFPTPSTSFNILSNGGFRPASLVELWGPTKSGKSTFGYGVAELSYKKHGAGLVIIDVELSTDPVRMKRAFNLLKGPVVVGRKEIKGKKGKILRVEEYFLEEEEGRLCSFDKDEEGKPLTNEANVYGFDDKGKLVVVDSTDIPKHYGDYCLMVSPYIEDAISRLAVLCDVVNLPLVVIYDSIAAHITKTFFNDMTKMYGGGMAEEPKIIKRFLSGLMTKMYLTKPPMLVLILNQIYSKINPFGGSSIASGGGNALKHNVHYNLSFSSDEPIKDPDGRILYYLSKFQLEKSKFTPSYPLNGKAFNLYISERDGGVILEKDSFIADLFDFGIVTKPAGWIKLPFIDKSLRYDEFYDMFDEFRSDLIRLCREHIMEELAAVKWQYEEEGVIFDG